ncbi:MAG TPA: 5-(carboxyamino)imidazole ribonucleotide synthase [Caulobacteraceae bacterium]|jgi:5-(carboxyamino)imidazole ribonucleotide synthase|nr:5-(carboxyamino)imidazole ribonucleotide synthase [Caulobacteraceae bacterium]
MPDFPLPPGATIGILGGGQLGRMLALAAARLGFDVAILTPQADSPASRVAARTFVAGYEDPGALAELAAASAVVTFEFENVPAGAVEQLVALGAAVAPDARALAIAQDRLAEKTFLNEAGLPTVGFAAVDTEDDLAAAFAKLGGPLLLKTRRGGYDGKGQVWVGKPGEGRAALAAIGHAPAIVETPADFQREVAMIAARGRNGETALYSLTESHHESGILRRTTSPARDSHRTAPAAEKIVGRLIRALDYVGVLGVELFERDDGTLLVNEFAPRVHNTGHWTLDGCQVDQFEQHIRAIAGWPLGPTNPLRRVEMVNLLGDEANDWRRYAGEADARVWLYGKGEARPGRKMGHVNRLRPLDGEG